MTSNLVKIKLGNGDTLIIRKCSKCNEGTMEYTDKKIYNPIINSDQYIHQCNICENNELLDVIFPIKETN